MDPTMKIRSTFDYALLGLLGAGAAWYFLFREKKEEPATPSYVIQPASMPSMSMSANRYRERQGFGFLLGIGGGMTQFSLKRSNVNSRHSSSC